MRCVLLQLAGSVLIAPLLAGPGTVSPAEAHDATPPPNALPEVVVTRDGGESSTCGPREAATLVAHFVDAFNRGDQDLVMTFFGSDFKWFGVGVDEDWTGASDFFAYDPASGFASAGPEAVVGSAEETLPPYVADRQAHGERWQLIDIGVYSEPDGAFSSIFFHVARSADDLPPSNSESGHRFVGKGQVNCTTATIILWSMNPVRPGTADDQPVCPAPSTDAASTTIVACGPPSSRGCRPEPDANHRDVVNTLTP